MRALLVLFMVDAVESGGMGITEQKAGAIYGLYTASVYLVALPGGWIADRLLGAQRAVWIGGIIIASGHFTLAIEGTTTFYVGLILVVTGTGFLKPNISAIVGHLYPEGGARRDAGFTLFYMGINLGSFLGPLICSYLGENVNWHAGFAAAGVGMVFGLIQYKLSSKQLGGNGRHPHPRDSSSGGLDPAWYFVLGGVGIVATVLVLCLTKVIPFNPLAVAKNATYVIVTIAAVFFVSIYAFGNLTGDREAAYRRDHRLVPGVRGVLVGLRAGRLFLESLRRSAHRPPSRVPPF